MAILKGLIAWTAGLVGVLAFCGSVSGIVEEGAESFYALTGAEMMLSRGLTCVIWLVMFVYLAFFFSFVFIYLKRPIYIVVSVVFLALHSACCLCLFKFSIPFLALCCLVLITCIYSYIAYKLLKKLPKFAIIFLPYLLWLTYLFVVLYKILIIN